MSQQELELDPSLVKAAEVVRDAELLQRPLNGSEVEIVERAVQQLEVPDLILLLQFVPPIELKKRAESLAAVALAIDVTGKEGVEAADAALVPLREALDAIEKGFEQPTAKAHQLHKRMTGLRADFKEAGEAAVKTVGDRIYREDKRLREEAESLRLQSQSQADEQARTDAAAAAKDARASGAPAAVVREMREAAKTATAPPVVSPVATPSRTHSTSVEKRKARFSSTAPGAEPNPNMKDLTPAQLKQARDLMRDTADGKPGTDMTFFSIDWTRINAVADKQRSTFNCPHLETFDAGGTRAKPRRKR